MKKRAIYSIAIALPLVLLCTAVIFSSGVINAKAKKKLESLEIVQIEPCYSRIYETIEQITEYSDYIAVVKPLSYKEQFLSHGEMVVFKCLITEEIFGLKKDSEIEITMSGLMDTDDMIFISDTPMMRIGQEYMVFLQKDNNDGQERLFIIPPTGQYLYNNGKISSLQYDKTLNEKDEISVMKKKALHISETLNFNNEDSISIISKIQKIKSERPDRRGLDVIQLNSEYTELYDTVEKLTKKAYGAAILEATSINPFNGEKEKMIIECKVKDAIFGLASDEDIKIIMSGKADKFSFYAVISDFPFLLGHRDYLVFLNKLEDGTYTVIPPTGQFICEDGKVYSLKYKYPFEIAQTEAIEKLKREALFDGAKELDFNGMELEKIKEQIFMNK